MPTSSSKLAASNPADILGSEISAALASRAADYATENACLLKLARALRDTPVDILKVLATTALEVCGAGSAGISILETPAGRAPQFRWRALAGAWTPYLGGVMPRTGSPSGRVLDCNTLLLVRDPINEYPCVVELRPDCREALLAPFCLDGVPAGTLWIVKHEPRQHFDSEDARVLSNLAEFTSAAYQTVNSTQLLNLRDDARRDENTLLVDADRSKDAFIATIAHEIRDPLAPLLNASAVLKMRATDSAVVTRAADLILRQVRTISRLVEDLLDVSRVRLGTLELKTGEVELGDILQSAIAASGLVTGPTTHRLELGPIESPIRVIADEMRLSQVLRNLLNNAAKYTDAAGVIKITLRREGAEGVISISDSGIGIDADQLETIFDLFAQAGQSGTQRSGGGLGIGLHLARQLVVAHGGTLTAQSGGRGCGSTFTVRLNSIGGSRALSQIDR
jgi:signal transduction histidine kinase